LNRESKVPNSWTEIKYYFHFPENEIPKSFWAQSKPKIEAPAIYRNALFVRKSQKKTISDFDNGLDVDGFYITLA
jgi:hypothetical protein